MRKTLKRKGLAFVGGRGGMAGASLGHAYTTGASQELYQMTGRTPGLSSGGKRSTGKRSTSKRRATRKHKRNHLSRRR